MLAVGRITTASCSSCKGDLSVGKKQSHDRNPGNRNKGKGNGAGLAWESQSHCFADKFGITHAHSFNTDTQHDYSQGNFFRVLISK